MKDFYQPMNAGTLINDFLKKALSIKYVYIALVVVFLAFAFYVNRYATTQYQVQASILLKKTSNTAILASSEMFRNPNFLQENRTIEDEVILLSSFNTVSKTVASMKLEVSYYFETNNLISQKWEIFDQSPIEVELDKSHLQAIDVQFYIEVHNDSTFTLKAQQENVSLYNYIDNDVDGKVLDFKVNQKYRFNEEITTDKYKFVVVLKEKGFKTNSETENYSFKLNHLDYLSRSLLGRIQAEPVSPLGSIIKISFSGENIEMITKFLNNYIDLSFEANLAKKNKASNSTIAFIDNQISNISDSLMSSEFNLKNYKSENQVMDLSFQGQRIFDKMTQMENEKSAMLAQQRYYIYIIDYIGQNKDLAGISPPSMMNVVDPILNQLITDLLALNTQRLNILSSNNTKSLFINEIDNRINIQKNTILENVKNNLNTLNLSLNELNYRFDKLSGEISKLPKTEIRLVGLERKYKLNDAFVTFLQQKRAEAEIAKESNNPDYEVLTPAQRINAFIIYPKKMLNYLIAFFLAILLPSVFIILRDFLKTSIGSIQEIQQISGRKISGVVFSNKLKTELVTIEYPNTSVSESIRALRTALQLKLVSDSCKVVMITSSMPGEGKSFIAINLAASLASIGKRTLLIDLDLRKSSLNKKFNYPKNVGLSIFLTGNSTIDEMVITADFPNLSFVPAGPIFPNPSELLITEHFDSLFDKLKEKYEYIILDTPPLGAVSDAFVLSKYANYFFLISRLNYTKKTILPEVLADIEKHELKNFDIVVNDMNFKKSSYGQYYGSYYSESK